MASRPTAAVGDPRPDPKGGEVEPMAALVSALGHDLKSLLNAIIGFSEILQAELFGPLGTDRYRGYAKDIADSGRRLLWLINLVLDAAKAESTPVAPEATGAEALLVGLAARAEERGAPVEFRVSDPTLLLMTDERALRHLLELLLLGSGPIKGIPDWGVS